MLDEPEVAAGRVVEAEDRYRRKATSSNLDASGGHKRATGPGPVLPRERKPRSSRAFSDRGAEIRTRDL